MYLIEILLPLCDNDGHPFAQDLSNRARRAYGTYDGVTAPPGRLPNETKAARIQDDIIVYEVMMEKVNRDGWKQYRVSLERTFRQEEIVVRAIAFDKL